MLHIFCKNHITISVSLPWWASCLIILYLLKSYLLKSFSVNAHCSYCRHLPPSYSAEYFTNLKSLHFARAVLFCVHHTVSKLTGWSLGVRSEFDALAVLNSNRYLVLSIPIYDALHFRSPFNPHNPIIPCFPQSSPRTKQYLCFWFCLYLP